jgi:hypothetical protein
MAIYLHGEYIDSGLCPATLRSRRSHWSLVDNYEWGSYEPRFGIYGVDRKRHTTAFDIARRLGMHGNTSAVVVETLAQLGYKDIVELRGGMAAGVESKRTLKAASG